MWLWVDHAAPGPGTPIPAAGGPRIPAPTSGALPAASTETQPKFCPLGAAKCSLGHLELSPGGSQAKAVAPTSGSHSSDLGQLQPTQGRLFHFCQNIIYQIYHVE